MELRIKMKRKSSRAQPKFPAPRQALDKASCVNGKRRRWFWAISFGAAMSLGAAAWTLVQWALTPAGYLAVLQLPRLNATAPGAVADFFERYHGRSPVVILGALDSWPAMRWTTASLSARCPDARVPQYAYDPTGGQWAALREVSSRPLPEYLGAEFGQPARPAQQRMYALEMSLRSECPQLLADVRVPAFFADDMLLRYYNLTAWPTLIAGPQGTRSGLHRDTHDFPFYMAMFSGRKQWRILSSEAGSRRAYEPYFDPATNGFGFDPFAPDMRRFPALGEVAVYDHVLEPGQLLYIPSGAPHAAFNLEDTIAISGNYLDSRSLPHHQAAACGEGGLWMNSPLCVGYMFFFEKHPAVAPDALRETSYFELAGPGGPVEWCDKFESNLRRRAERRPELARNIPIVAGYCRDVRATGRVDRKEALG